LLLLIETSENPYALAIEQILKPEEIVIKPLGNPLKSVPEFLGATILGDGSVVPVLDLIPLLQKSTARMRKQRPTVENQAPPLKPKTEFSVLIVDDSPSVRQINSKIVKNAGWQVLVAKDGLEALETLQAASELPDVILTDVEMPRMDGYELLATLQRQERLRRIPVVMITSRAGEKHRRKAFDLGVSEYLTKPYEDNILLDKIKTLANFK
jgi:chemosensory pili system protein ChpA (sensor histidine kinase/response regulator)